MNSAVCFCGHLIIRDFLNLVFETPLYLSDLPGTHCVDQPGFELPEICLPLGFNMLSILGIWIRDFLNCLGLLAFAEGFACSGHGVNSPSGGFNSALGFGGCVAHLYNACGFLLELCRS